MDNKVIVKTKRSLIPGGNDYIKVKFSTFPAGEEYVQIIDTEKVRMTPEVRVVILSADSQTIMRALLVADAIKYITQSVKIILEAPYLPYGRQDRVCALGESFSLRLFADIIQLRFDRVDTYDPHSIVTNSEFGYMLREENVEEDIYLNNNFIKITKIEGEVVGTMVGYLGDAIGESSDMVSICPDKGAVNRSSNLAEVLNIPTIFMDKTRSADGISYTTDTIMTEFSRAIVVDDICDGGGTFLALSSFWRDRNPDLNMIAVFSHGIFSQGFDKLLEAYDTIYVIDDDYNRHKLSAVNID